MHTCILHHCLWGQSCLVTPPGSPLYLSHPGLIRHVEGSGGVVLPEPHALPLILTELCNVHFLNICRTCLLFPIPIHHPSPGPETSSTPMGPLPWWSRHQTGHFPGYCHPFWGHMANSVTSLVTSRLMWPCPLAYMIGAEVGPSPRMDHTESLTKKRAVALQWWTL